MARFGLFYQSMSGLQQNSVETGRNRTSFFQVLRQVQIQVFGPERQSSTGMTDLGKNCDF